MQVPTLHATDVNQFIKDPDNCILDIRPTDDFANGFIAGSYFLPHTGFLADVLSIHDFSAFSSVIIIAEAPASEPLVNAIFKALGNKVSGVFYPEGNDFWPPVEVRDMIIAIDPDELAMDLPFDDNLVLVDVRSALEYADGHIKDARHFPLEDLSDPANIAMIPEEANIYLYCSNGQRSMLVASVFKIHGLHNLRVVNARWEDISATPGLSVEKDAKQLN